MFYVIDTKWSMKLQHKELFFCQDRRPEYLLLVDLFRYCRNVCHLIDQIACALIHQQLRIYYFPSLTTNQATHLLEKRRIYVLQLSLEVITESLSRLQKLTEKIKAVLFLDNAWFQILVKVNHLFPNLPVLLLLLLFNNDSFINQRQCLCHASTDLIFFVWSTNSQRQHALTVHALPN